MEESTPALATPSYYKIIEGYKLKLRSNPDLKLSEYCKEFHANYNGVIDWTSRHGISVLKLRREARGEITGYSLSPEYEESFIQFVPSSRSTSSNLRGISITFPDGVNLTLQESSVEGVISLLVVYQSRRGGASSCLD